MKKIYFQLSGLFCAMSFTTSAHSSPPLNSIPQQIQNYKTCITSILKTTPTLSWLDAFAACSARNDSITAAKCMGNLQSSDPTLDQSVVAMACAGGSKVAPVLDCMNTLSQIDGFDPSITNSACSGGGSAAQAELCMNDLMKPSAQSQFGVGNVTAGILCGAGNTAPQALACYKSVANLDEVYAAQACSGGNDSTWVNHCVAYGMSHLKDLAGTTGQEDRAASFACANSLIK